MPKAKSADCKCTDIFTCRHCLDQVVYVWTLSKCETWEENYAAWLKKNNTK